VNYKRQLRIPNSAIHYVVNERATLYSYVEHLVAKGPKQTYLFVPQPLCHEGTCISQDPLHLLTIVSHKTCATTLLHRSKYQVYTRNQDVHIHHPIPGPWYALWSWLQPQKEEKTGQQQKCVQLIRNTDIKKPNQSFECGASVGRQYWLWLTIRAKNKSQLCIRKPLASNTNIRVWGMTFDRGKKYLVGDYLDCTKKIQATWERESKCQMCRMQSRWHHVPLLTTF